MPTGCAQDESDKKCRKWESSTIDIIGGFPYNIYGFTQCKSLDSVFEVDAIVSFKASFGLPVEKVQQALAECDMGRPLVITLNEKH